MSEEQGYTVGIVPQAVESETFVCFDYDGCLLTQDANGTVWKRRILWIVVNGDTREVDPSLLGAKPGDKVDFVPHKLLDEYRANKEKK